MKEPCLLGVQSVLFPTFPHLSNLISDFGLILFILIFLQYNKDLLIKKIRIMEPNNNDKSTSISTQMDSLVVPQELDLQPAKGIG